MESGELVRSRHVRHGRTSRDEDQNGRQGKISKSASILFHLESATPILRSCPLTQKTVSHSHMSDLIVDKHCWTSSQENGRLQPYRGIRCVSRARDHNPSQSGSYDACSLLRLSSSPSTASLHGRKRNSKCPDRHTLSSSSCKVHSDRRCCPQGSCALSVFQIAWFWLSMNIFVLLQQIPFENQSHRPNYYC